MHLTQAWCLSSQIKGGDFHLLLSYFIITGRYIYCQTEFLCDLHTNDLMRAFSSVDLSVSPSVCSHCDWHWPRIRPRLLNIGISLNADSLKRNLTLFEKVRLKRENTNEWYVIVPQSSKAAADGPFALFAVKTRYVSDSNKIRISTIIIYDFTFQAVLSIFSKIISLRFIFYVLTPHFLSFNYSLSSSNGFQGINKF